MHDGIGRLTDREKEALRLLVAGHDAKSIARHLGLSVHTINERLRDARRKLDVSSSREAARHLAQAERTTPDSVTDRFLGVPETAGSVPLPQQAIGRQPPVPRLAWFGGGMLVMSLVVAGLALSPVLHGNAAPMAAGLPLAISVPVASAAASLGSAQAWLALVDHRSWEQSWRTAAPLFQSNITAPQWATTIEAVRQPLGPVSSRVFQSVTKAGALPGVPAGDYEVLQFRTDFANRHRAVETVTLARDPSGWKVVGYFIR